MSQLLGLRFGQYKGMPMTQMDVSRCVPGITAGDRRYSPVVLRNVAKNQPVSQFTNLQLDLLSLTISP
jgi:hypothetical protein